MRSKTFGCILITAGTCIGGGMLAMPLAFSQVGLQNTVLLFVALWALNCHSALLLTEVYKKEGKAIGLSSLVQMHYGTVGKIIVTASLLVLLYALTTAYMKAAGDIISEIWKYFFHKEISSKLAILIFSLASAFLMYLGTKAVDHTNRLLFTGKIFVFIFLIVFMVAGFKFNNLKNWPSNIDYLYKALPTAFVAFGFHVCIPSIYEYTRGKKMYFIMITGSLIPLIAYLMWLILIFGVLPYNKLGYIQQGGLESLVATISRYTSNKVSAGTHAFASLAILTSFLGVSLSLWHYLKDFLCQKNNMVGSTVSAVATFVPPLAFAILQGQAFEQVLVFASLPSGILTLFVPSFLALKVRKNKGENLTSVYMNLFLSVIIMTICFIQVYKA